MIDVLLPVLWLLFVLGCLLVCLVVLLQEGKGGGLGEAFGGIGQQTFGVKAGGIQKFTAYAIVGLVVVAILITKLRDSSVVPIGPAAPPPVETPDDGGGADG